MSSNNRTRRRRIRWGRLVFIIILFLTVIGLGAGAGFAFGALRNMPEWDPAALEAAATTILLDKDDQPFDELHGAENRLPVRLNQIPVALQEAFIATEDARFYQHHGVDPRAIARAFFVNLASPTGSIEQGGSTITQQLAKNAFIDRPEKTYRRKLQEAFLAIQLERRYTKQEILELYLNRIYFDEGAYGVQAAAQTYFNKDVQELTLGESALLAGVVKSPFYYSPFKNKEASLGRRNIVLANMETQGYISPEQAEAARSEPLKLAESRENRTKYKYPYFTDYVIITARKLLEENGIDAQLLYTGGLRVYTTLDTRTQAKIEEVYADDKNFPASRDDVPVQSAMVVLDPHSGSVRGLIGGRSHTVQLGLNIATQLPRQPGSAIKPIAVYGPALEKGYMPATVIDDVPISLPNAPGQKPYEPENYDEKFHGLVSMREAVRLSHNVPAVKMLLTIGVNTGYNFARNLGLPLNADDKFPPLALGGISKGVTALDMAAAYGAFANQGVYMKPQVVRQITDSSGRVLTVSKQEKRVVMSEQTAYLMTDMLQTVVQSGTGTRARLDRPVAGKTGTTELPPALKAKGLKGTKDAWFAAYTPELVGIVWMGYKDTDEKHYLQNVAGGSYPAQIWKQVIEESLKGVPVKQFPRPRNMVYARVDSKSGLLPSALTPESYLVNEVFTANTVPKDTSNVWVETKICATTGQLATPYCPDIVTGVYLQRPVPYEGDVKPLDYELEAPSELCTLHGPGATSTLATICTDPRHGGAPVLANIPGTGQSGGCPPNLRRQEAIDSLSAQSLPYCNLPEHQVSAPAWSPSISSPGNNGINNWSNGTPPETNEAGQPANRNDQQNRQPGIDSNENNEGEAGSESGGGAGPGTGSGESSVTGEAPNLGGRLVPSDNGKPSVELFWGQLTVPNLRLSVERRNAGEASGQVFKVTEGTRFVDRQIQAGQEYYYRLFVTDANGRSIPSNEVLIKIP